MIDIVIFGATGFTGRLVAEYFVEKARAGSMKASFALAGRSREKLERVRDELAVSYKPAKELPLVIGDSNDPASVDAMVAGARVVCTTVGPYMRYGKALVAACAKRGVHYCDLTGETPFIRDAIDEHHARAAESGARIVPSCGFDSIPSDLGVLTLHEHFRARGDRLAEARYQIIRMRGGASGGTIASMLDLAELAKDKRVRRVLADPYALLPSGAPRGPRVDRQMGPRRDAANGKWTGPFVMAAINVPNVLRSNALLDFAYGSDFAYSEAMSTGRGARGFATAAITSAVFGVGGALALTSPGRALLRSFLPKPGEGPSKDARETGEFRVEIQGKSARGDHAKAIVGANKDPGYGATAIMLGESALCLAEDDLGARAGVLTTASCMGMKLVARLRAAGMTFEVE